MTSGYTWPELISALMAGEDLSTEQTRWAMGQIMAGEASGAQFAGFAVALRNKGETAAEVEGLLAAMSERAQPLPVDGPALDIVGTGGDMAATVNISTMSAIVAAAAGARVVKHGNRAASSACGSADVLVALGVVIDLPADEVARCVDEVGIGFAFAPVFHPAMKHVGAYRKELGVPTVFNVLGPLSNPAGPSAQMVGCANLALAPVMADVLASRGTSSFVIRGNDGLDEISIFDDTSAWDTRGGSVTTGVIELARTGVDNHEAGHLRGGTADLNASIARAVFAGDSTGPLRAVRDAVALNTAASLVAWDYAIGAATATAGGDLTETIVAAMPRAYEVIDSGAVTALLDRWIEVSNKN